MLVEVSIDGVEVIIDGVEVSIDGVEVSIDGVEVIILPFLINDSWFLNFNEISGK